MNDLTVIPSHNVAHFRASTDAATLCGAIVQKTAMAIQNRRYVTVEGWQAIAIAHGCAASARSVEKVDGGVRAVGEVRRMDDGTVIAEGEGFVGEDEPTWYGGKNKWGKEQPKRPDYAIRAMAQTRAISRACRSAFAHVVVMIDAGLSTTPAEEVPEGGFVEGNFREGASSPDKPANTLRDQLEQSVEQIGTGEPAPRKRENWGGRYPNKTALHKALVHVEATLADFQETDAFEAYLTTAEYTDFIAACDAQAPHYLEGGEPAPEEFKGIFALEKATRDRLALAEANGLPDYINEAAERLNAG